MMELFLWNAIQEEEGFGGQRSHSHNSSMVHEHHVFESHCQSDKCDSCDAAVKLDNLILWPVWYQVMQSAGSAAYVIMLPRCLSIAAH